MCRPHSRPQCTPALGQAAGPVTRHKLEMAQCQISRNSFAHEHVHQRRGSAVQVAHPSRHHHQADEDPPGRPATASCIGVHEQVKQATTDNRHRQVDPLHPSARLRLLRIGRPMQLHPTGRAHVHQPLGAPPWHGDRSEARIGQIKPSAARRASVERRPADAVAQTVVISGCHFPGRVVPAVSTTCQPAHAECARLFLPKFNAATQP